MLFLNRLADKLFSSYQDRSLQARLSTRNQLKVLNKLNWFVAVLSAAIGAIFILLYYLPLHAFEKLFNSCVIEITIFGIHANVFWLKLLDLSVLTFAELYCLGVINVVAIQRMAWLLDFPKKEMVDFNLHKKNLSLISLEKKQKQELELGMDPFYGMSKMYMYLMLIIYKLKAVMSNFIIKLILRRFASRYVLKLFIDLAAMPIYAFWNAWVSCKIFSKAKYYIFSVQLTETLAANLAKQNENESIKFQLEGLLSFLVMLKRDFSEINYYYSLRMINAIGTEIKRVKPSFDVTNDGEDNQLDTLFLLFAAGVILDGNISYRERKYIKTLLKSMEEPPLILLEIDVFLSKYKEGKAIEFLNAKGYSIN